VHKIQSKKAGKVWPATKTQSKDVRNAVDECASGASMHANHSELLSAH